MHVQAVAAPSLALSRLSPVVISFVSDLRMVCPLHTPTALPAAPPPIKLT